MERRVILRVPVDSVTRAQALDCVQKFLSDGAQHHIATPNPEMLVAAQASPELLCVLQLTSLNIPDGIGLLYAASFLGFSLPERVTGVDLMTDICTKLPEVRVFFLGAAPGIAERTAHILSLSRPSLIIAGTFAGSPSPKDEELILRKITHSQANALFVAYGSPAQELWIARNLSKIPNIRIAMGVGGAFDFLAKQQVRAPLFLQTFGLEWLWRLFHEPRRFLRIFHAVIEFPVRVFLEKSFGQHR